MEITDRTLALLISVTRRLVSLIFMALSTHFTYQLEAQPSTSYSAPLILSDNAFVQGVYHKNGHFIVLTKTCYYELNPDDRKGWRSHFYKKNELDTALLFFNSLNYVPSTKGTYFLLNGGGNVYSFQDSSLIRIDQSFPHKNQNNSGYFFHQNKIYNYGGYGFFTQKDYITEFSLDNPQWFVFGYAKGSRIPPPRDNMVYNYDAKRATLFVATGDLNPSPAVAGSTKKRLQDAWKLNLKTRTWKKLGYIPDHNLVTEISRPLHARGQFYVVQSEQSKKLFVINIPKNTIRAFNGKNNINHRVNTSFSPIYSPIKDKVLVVLLPEIKSNDKEFIFQSIPLSDLEGHLLYSRPYYYPTSWFILGILSFLVIPVSLFYGYRKLKAFRVAPDKALNMPIVLNLGKSILSYDGNLIPFDQEHIQLIIHFQKNNWELTNSLLLEAVRIGQESQEALKKRKNRLLEEINQQFTFTTRLTDPFIIEVKDQADRRYKEFLVNPVYTEHILVVA